MTGKFDKYFFRRLSISLLMLLSYYYLFSLELNKHQKILVMIGTCFVITLIFRDIRRTIEIKIESVSFIPTSYAWVYKILKEINGNDKVEELFALRKVIIDRCENNKENYKALDNFLEICYPEKKKFTMVPLTAFSFLSSFFVIEEINLNSVIFTDLNREVCIYFTLLTFLFNFYLLLNDIKKRDERIIKLMRKILKELIEESQ